MTQRITSTEDVLSEHAQMLFDAAGTRRVLQGIDELLARYRAVRSHSTQSQLLDESDVLLITYADTLVTDVEPPLRVLRRFYEDYLEDVFGLLHILPFHPYSSDDGFSVIDYHAVRNDLGDWGDLSELAGVCRLMADAVINHTSSESRWFLRFLEGDPAYAEFYVEASPGTDLSSVVRPRTTPLLTVFQDGNGNDRHVWTTFSADQVDLDYRNPEVLLAVLDVLFFLVEKGARLLRLDAVTFLWKEPGTTSANLEETHRLIKIMRAAISMLRDDVVIITETNVPHRENIAYFGDGHDEAQMVYNFALPPLLAHSFITGDSSHLSEWARTLGLPSDEVCFLNFSASHDGVGMRPVEEILDDEERQTLVRASLAAGGKVSSRTAADGREHPYELNCTYLDLISSSEDDVSTLVDRFVASQAIVLAMPGVPAVYIQSLLGTRNDVDRARETGRARSINRSEHVYADVKRMLADPQTLTARVFGRLTALIRLRRQQPAFDPYAAFEVPDMGTEVFALRRGEERTGASILCITNLTGKGVSVDIPAAAAGKDLVSGEAIAAGQHEMAPYAVCWIAAGQ